jgi:23S rRNA pseudouridine1911/1915/1917 synthase
VREGGSRLDRFLAGEVEGLSRGFLKGLVQRGCVLVDGKARGPDYRLRAGELVELRWPGSEWAASGIEDRVLHEDDDILVLDKPSGLLMHPAGESWEASPEASEIEAEPNLAGFLHARGALREAAGLERCGLVHRLDRQTSGVLVVAKTPAAQGRLLEAFREREVRKVYRAIVLGEMSSARVSAPVGRIRGMRRVQATEWGRDAETVFRVLGSGRGVTQVRAEPLTGRTHQIRAHLALLKHPVLGDGEWFGASGLRRLSEMGLPAPARMMLHAWRISFLHPRTGREASFTAPVPGDFRDYWKSVKI